MIRFDRRFLFIIPAFILYTIFMMYPLFNGVALSFTQFAGVGEAKWIGIGNYQEILTNNLYIKILLNTLFYTFLVVFFQNGIGLILAALLHNLAFVRNLFRSALLIPSMMSLVIAGYVWQYLYSPVGGGLNESLAAIGLTKWQQIWLGDPSIALISVASVHIWMYIGYSTAIFLAGFASISTEVQEAAKMDGASSLKRFFHVDLPLLAPAMTVNITLSTINSLKSFEFPYIMTSGGPDNATMTLGLKIFRLIFAEYKFGMAASLSVVLIVMVAFIAVVQNRYLRSREDRI